MAIDSALQFFGLSLEVFLIDLLLSGDNAVVIALACRRLPPPDRRQVMVIGTGLAILLRLLMTLLASFLLRLPLLKLAGGMALVVIAVRLTLDEEDEAQAGPATDAVGMISALQTVIVADLVMSTDNVMALAALAGGHVGVLALGLACSVPLLMFGSWFVGRLLADYPVLIPAGGALLGWVAGDIAISDPLYARWIEEQSPFLAVAVPALTAVYVLVQTRIIRRQLPTAQALRPQPVRREIPPLAALAQPGPATIHAPIQVAVWTAPIPAPLELDDDEIPELASTSTDASAAAPPPEPSLWVSPFLIVGGVLTAVGTLIGLLYMARMPQPTALNRYDCLGSSYVISYAPGRPRIRIASGATVVDGSVLPGNQIEWGQVPGGTALSTPLPTTILYADTSRLGLGAPGTPGLSCTKR